ncbi:MAG: FtsX-like permease family protein [Mogibacterium sp.]|nr:FtsX-like permease family protein [Mogibacterium sp.]
MKKTQRKDAFRNIKKRIVSFLSLCLVIMLGLGALLTTRYMGAGLNKKLTDYYGDRSFKNYEMVSSLGVSEKSLEKIRQTDGVIVAEGVIQADATISHEGRKISGTVLSQTKEVSVPELTEGNLPRGKAECAVGEDAAEVNDLKVGDKIKISLTGLDALGDESPLYEKEFTITGLIHHPDRLRRRSVNTFVLPVEAFNKEATDGLYTNVFIRAEEPEKTDIFSDAYFEKMEETTKTLEDLAEELGVDRTKEMKDEANAKIDEEWKKALAQMDDAQAQIDEGEAELNAKLADGRAKLNGYQNKLNKTVAKYRKQIRDGEAEIKKYRGWIEKADKLLPKVKKERDKLRKQYTKEIEEYRKTIAGWQKMLDEINKIKDLEKKLEKLKDLAKLVIEKQETIRKVVEFFKKPEIMKIAEAIKEITEGKVDLTGVVKTLASIDVDKLVDLADKVINADKYGKEAEAFIKELEKSIKAAQDWLDKLDELDKYINKYEKNRPKYVALLDKKDKEVQDAKKKLAAEERKYQKMINAGWSRYYAEKAKYESKLEEAKLLLEENKEEAEKKLAEARAEVENMEPCRWITLDRRANSGYVDARSNLAAITSAGNVFGILFMIVTAIVCLSTLIIIIDEQKKLVGTSKAFGFHKGEILGKYLTFGASAAVVGSVLAATLGYVLSGIVQVKYAESGMYQIGPAKSVFTPGITALAALAILLVTIIASIIACGDILKSPASVLMKGEVLKKEKGKKKKEASRAGTLYSRLIMRNMAEDKARVFVTIAIIAFSCMLIGMGISMKLAYDGMTDKQISDVNKYDLKVTMNSNVTEEQEKKLNSVLASEGVKYLPAASKTMLYKWDGRIDGLQLICADPQKIGEFYAITDPKTKEPVAVPESGVLIQKRMNESYKMDIGDKLPILDNSLKENNAEIKGYFVNYVGRTVIASPSAYKAIFGKKHEENSFFIILDGADEDKLKKDLLAVTDEISFTEKDDFKTRFASVAKLYNIIVILITGMAILISFMILTNLSNIFLTRRKTELSVMRVNGFSVKQAKGYLSKETVFTTGAGLVLGVVLGAILTPPVIGLLQQPDLEFVKSFHPIAWIIAVALEAIFAILINSVIFNKVKKLNLRDIA